MVPDRSEHLIAKSKHQKVVDYLLPKVVINAKDFVLSPVRVQASL